MAIAPLLLVRGWWRRCPVRILAPPLNNHAPRSGFLTARAPRAAVMAVVEYLARSRQWDMMLLDGIPGQSGLVPALSEAAVQRLRLGRQQPPWSHAYLAIEGTWEQYLARQKRHFRKHLWQAERALTQMGTVTVERYDRPETVPIGMQVFMEIDSESWKAKEGESLALHPAVGAYYTDLAERFAQRQRCEIWTLKIAHEPTAAFLCLCDNRVLYTLKTSYKEKFASARYSPSIVLLARIVEEAWERKLSGIDFVGRMPFVERWTAAGREFDRLVAFRRHPYSDLVRLVDWTRRCAGRVKYCLDSRLR